jgi:hypothetical protein
MAAKLETVTDSATASNDAEAAAAPPEVPKAKVYHAAIYPKEPIANELAEIVIELEKSLGFPIWMLVQTGSGANFDQVADDVYEKFREKKAAIVPKEKIGLLIHSPGGQAACAYQIARLFQRRTDEFYTLVPLYAKSAATLITVGGKQIYMGSEAELGPLDVQIYDDDKGQYDSALNAIQSLERLNAYALTAFDQAMQLLMMRTGKKADFLMDHALLYATNMMRPLSEKLETVELTRKSRELKVAEDYAVRLMRANYSLAEAQRIASQLVERYSIHEFVIDRSEAGSAARPGVQARALNLGLHIAEVSAHVEGLFDRIVPYLEKCTILGRIEEKT